VSLVRLSDDFNKLNGAVERENQQASDVSSDWLICLYGSSGSGKTRLLQAIEKAVKKEGVLRIRAESMVREMIASLHFAELTEFRQKYLSVENLLIDNLWVLEKRPAAAGEICHLLRERQVARELTVVVSELPEEAWAARNGAVARLLSRGLGIHLGAQRFFAAHVQ